MRQCIKMHMYISYYIRKIFILDDVEEYFIASLLSVQTAEATV